MKTLFFVTFLILVSFCSNAQVDSITFVKRNVEIKSTNVDEITVNKTKMKTFGEPTLYISLDGKCNYILPRYSQLTEGITNFKKIKTNAQASISALGSSLSVEKKSEFYVFYFTRTKSFYCPENTLGNKISYGVGVYVILKISDLKVKLDINTPYDIAAAGQLGLAKIELDIKHFGMTPDLASEFLPKTLGKIDIEAAKYFDQLLENSKTKINDGNTIPTLLPLEL